MTSVQDNTLRKMRRLGFTAGEVAEKLGKTEDVIRYRAEALGIPFSIVPGTSRLANLQTTDYSRERVSENRLRENDRMFVKKLAEAFFRGDHLPAGESKTLRLLG